MNEVRHPGLLPKLQEDRALFLRLFKAFKTVVRHALDVSAQVFMELPRSCGYWKYPSVETFLRRHGFVPCLFDGCMYGLTTLDGGQLMKKPWKVMCCNSELYTGLYDRCDGQHEHAQGYSGKDLTATQGYTPQIANIVHQCIVNDAYSFVHARSNNLVSCGYACAGIALDVHGCSASSELLCSKPVASSCTPAMAQIEPETVVPTPEASAASGAGGGEGKGASADIGAERGAGKASPSADTGAKGGMGNRVLPAAQSLNPAKAKEEVPVRAQPLEGLIVSTLSPPPPLNASRGGLRLGREPSLALPAPPRRGESR